MRKLENWKRTGALVLATVMLTGMLALPASAQADTAYTNRLAALVEKEWNDPAAYRAGLKRLMQQHPDSPEPYYLYAVNLWSSKILREEALTEADQQEILSYADTAIGLALQTETPYQSRWSYGEAEWPNENGEEPDYATLAAQLRVDVLSEMPGHQAELNDAMQQYLDCLDRGTRIQMKDCERRKNEIYDYEGKMANCQWYLNQDIPASRAELARIRSWTGTEAAYVTHEDSAGYTHYRVGLSADRKSVTIDSNVWNTSKQIQSVQRTLNEIVLFVPAGTVVTPQGGGWSQTIKKGVVFSRGSTVFVGV